MRVVLTGTRSADVDGRLLLDPRRTTAAPTGAVRGSVAPGHWRDPSAPHDEPHRQGPAPGPLTLHTTGGPGRDRPWPGDRRHVAGLTVLALPAALPSGGPDPERVHLLVTDEAGARLLWAPLGGPLPQATLSALRGVHVDLLVLGATGAAAPHGLGGMGGLLADASGSLLHDVARLREVGALDGRSVVAAVPLDDAPSPGWRLPWAATVAGTARAGAAGDSWTLTPGTVSDPLDDAAAGVASAVPATTSASVRPGSVRPAPGRSVPASVPARRTLVLGPASGGKSAYAEALVAADPQVTYLATGPAPSPDDTDWTARVDRHRSRRPAWWSTAEAPSTEAVVRLLGEATGSVLWDSAGSWLTGVLDRHDAWTGATDWRRRVDDEAEAVVAAVLGCAARVVVVSEEVGWGVVPDTAAGRLFRDLLGAFNQRLAWECDAVLLVVAGRALPMPSAAPPVVAAGLPPSPVAVIAGTGAEPDRGR